MRIGVDLGGTKIEGVVLGDKGEILCRHRVATPQHDYLGTLNAVANLVERLEADCDLGAMLLPVGVGAPGSISHLTGRMKNCNSICLNGKALREDLQALLKRDVRIANDADCFALSETRDGAASGCANVFGVILGTGVGGGIVLNNQLLSGPNGIAGEWGHNPMPSVFLEQIQPRRCYCGRNNCIEAWLSGPAFEQSYRERTNKALAATQIVSAATAGDGQAVGVLEQYYDMLAAALAIVINVIDPEVVVLGGGLSNIESLYDEVPRRWARYVFTDHCETKLLRVKFVDSSGVRGAAWLW